MKNLRSPIALLVLALALPACQASPEGAQPRPRPEKDLAQSPRPTAPLSLPPENKRQVGSDESSEVIAFVGSDPRSLTRTADLDGDGDTDAIAIVANQDPNAPRTLLILTRGSDGRLQKTVENPNAVLAENGGGAMGDPLRSLLARKGGFEVAFEGGSRELWSHRYRFEYVPAKGTWQLTEFEDKVLDRLDGTSQQRTLHTSDFGDVTVEGFDPDALTTD